MLPALCVAVSGIFVFLLLLVVVLIFSAEYKDIVQETLEEEAENNQDGANISATAEWIFACCLYGICAGLFRCIKLSSLSVLPHFNANSFSLSCFSQESNGMSHVLCTHCTKQ